MINVSAALDCFIQVVDILRQNVTYDVNQRPVFAAPTVIPTPMVLQPATGADLQQMPEGEYSEEVLRVDSRNELVFGLDDNAIAVDKIQYQNWTYKVITRMNWSPYGYFSYLAVKVDLENKNG